SGGNNNANTGKNGPQKAQKTPNALDLSSNTSSITDYPLPIDPIPYTEKSEVFMAFIQFFSHWFRATLGELHHQKESCVGVKETFFAKIVAIYARNGTTDVVLSDI